MQDRFQCSLRRLFAFVASLGVACGAAKLSVLLGCFLGALSAGVFLASLRGPGRLGFVLHSAAHCLLTLAAGLFAALLSVSVIPHPQRNISALFPFLTFLFVCGLGIALKYRMAYHNRELIGRQTRRRDSNLKRVASVASPFCDSVTSTYS